MIYAEDVNYWKSSTSGMDTWLDKAEKEIRTVNGKVLGRMVGQDYTTNRNAIMIHFSIAGEAYKLIWPVLQPKQVTEVNLKAARIQAATALYHDVKARCVAAKFLGTRAAFFPFLILAGGQTATEVATPDIVDLMPKMLITGEIVED